MAKKNNVIDLEEIWMDYSDYDNEDFNDRKLFQEMKCDMISELSEYVDIYEETEYESLIENLDYSADLREWNERFDELLDWANYSNVKIKTGF